MQPLIRAIAQFFEDRRELFFSDYGTIMPAMRLRLDQLVQCPFQEFTKRLYLEGKCLELIVLKLAQMADSKRNTPLCGNAIKERT